MLANTTAPAAYSAAPASDALPSASKGGRGTGADALGPSRSPSKVSAGEADSAAAKSGRNGKDSFDSALRQAREAMAGRNDSEKKTSDGESAGRVAKNDAAGSAGLRNAAGATAAAGKISPAGAAALDKTATAAAKTAAAKAAAAGAAVAKGGAAGSQEAADAKAADATTASRAAAQSGAKKLAEAAEKEKAVAAAETSAAEAKDKKKKPGSAPTVELTLALALPGAPATQGAAEAAAGEKPGHGAVEKKGEAARKEPHLTVADLRHSAHSRAEGVQGGSDASNAQASAPPDPNRDLRPQHASDRSDLGRDLSLGAGNGSPDANRGRADPALAPARGADFQSLLAQKLHDGWNGEIVKNAHIVLKDGDSGIIRLRLKPESLGDVKIELNLSDKNISGRIVVQSDEAKHAFERNMNNLTDAFRQGGFESAKLEVSVGSGSQQGNQGSAGRDSDAAPFYSGRLRGATEPTAANRALAWTSARRGAVDILA